MTAYVVSPIVIDTLTRVQAYARTQKMTLHLVGGWVRDQLLGRSPRSLNVDLAVARGAIGHARALAAHLRGAFVLLDEDAGSARVVVSGAQGRVELDLSDFRGPTLEDDLRRRDFTVNAMAIPLEAWLHDPQHPPQPMDPLQGRQALARRTLIACFPGTFEEDPIRILRAFRFVAQSEFTLDPSLDPLLRRAVASLSRVSGERIRDELMLICATDRAGSAIASLADIGALEVLIPELAPGRGMDQGGYHHLSVLDHQLEAVRQSDRILADFSEFSEPLRTPLAAYCAEEPVEGRSRKSLIKLGALLHDVGKPAKRQVHEDGEIWFIGHEHSGAELAAPIVERLRLSNREAEMVVQLVRHHLRPGFLSREPELTRRAIYRFYKDLGDNGPACALTWWSDRMATRGPLSNVAQIDEQRGRLEALLTPYFFKVEDIVKPPRLVDGHRLMQELRLEPGTIVGELLGAIEEAQAEGRVHSPEEAMTLARQTLDARRKI